MMPDISPKEKKRRDRKSKHVTPFDKYYPNDCVIQIKQKHR